MAKKARQFRGIVVSTAMAKTIVVKVDRVLVHPRYKKRYTVSRKYACDYRGEGIKAGDKVVFAATRPLSKTKRWRIIAKV